LEPVLSQPEVPLPVPLSEIELRYHLEEFKALRTELQAEKKSFIDFFLYAVVASGGIAAWLFTHQTELAAYGTLITKMAAAIPLAVTAFAFYISWTVTGSIIGALGRYGRQLEGRVAASGLGWETFLATPAERLSTRVPSKMLLGWAALMLVNASLIVVA
jgi:hypothetical protein